MALLISPLNATMAGGKAHTNDHRKNAKTCSHYDTLVYTDYSCSPHGVEFTKSYAIPTYVFLPHSYIISLSSRVLIGNLSPCSVCMFFVIHKFLRISQAGSNSLVSAGGVTSFGSARIDKLPEPITSFSEKLIESRRTSDMLVRKSTAAPSKV